MESIYICFLGWNNEQFAVYYGAEYPTIYTTSCENEFPLSTIFSAGPKTVLMWNAEYNTYGNGSNINLTYKWYKGDVPTQNRWQKFYNINDQLGNVSLVLRKDDNIGTVVKSFDYAPFGKVLCSSSNCENRTKFIGKEKDKESNYADHGVRKYDDEIGRFTSIDPLWEKYYSLTPYQYSLNNPVSLKDINGKNAVGLVNDNTITIKAVYLVDSRVYNESQITNMKNDINKTLNDKNYQVTEGDYTGFNVKFDLDFKANPDASGFSDPSNYNEKGINIGNDFTQASNTEEKVIFPTKTLVNPNKNGFVKGTVGGRTDTFNSIIMNAAFDNDVLFKIHEIFHTFFNNSDNTKSGVHSYTNPCLPNQDDINETINNPALQKIRK